MFFGIIKFVGVVLFLYLTWRNLYENYKDDLLIFYSWVAILMFSVTGRLVFGLTHWGVWNDNLIDWVLFWQKPGFDYLGGVLGIFGVSVVFSRSYQWKLWSFLEDTTGTLCLFMAFLMTEELWMSNFSKKVLAYLVIAVIGYVISYYIAGKYRSLVWYKSGKKGFVFFFIMFLMSLLMAVQALIFKDRPIMLVLYLILSLISVVGLFILGEVFGSLEFYKKRRINGKNR